MKVSKRIKRLLAISFSALYAAGTGYWLSHLFLRKHGEFGDEPHFLERALAPIHLGAALIFIFILGIVWEKHIRTALKIHRHRFTGWSFIGLLCFLSLSGIVIIYASEDWIKLAQKIHPWVGVSLLPFLLIHVTKKSRSPSER